jgi:LppP/LprE lipoprotein
VTLALGVFGGAMLGGCGSGTKTVTAASSPPATQSTNSTAKTTTTAPATTPTAPATTPAQTTTNGGTPSPSTTRSAPEPAFTKVAPSQGAEGVSGAEAVLRAKGYTANDPSAYHSGQALRVLVGTRTGSGDGYGQQAFFFVNGHFLGTDSSQPSATVRVASQSDTEVTLEYPLYKRSDPLCCPGGGKASVRFQLNNGKLTPLDPIPPASSKSGLSRQ